MTLSLFLDVIVAVLLVATIFYAAMLNRRLAGLRSNKAELEALIHTFGEACARAEAGVKTLRSATDEATRLQAYLDRSQALRDDLSFLLDRGSGLADRLEGGVRSARVEVQSRPMPASDPEPAPGRAGRPLRGEPRPGAAEPEPMPPPRVRPLRERVDEAAVAAAAVTPGPAPIDAERAAERLAQRVTLGERPLRAPRPLRERGGLRTALAQAAGAAGAGPSAAQAPGPTVAEPPLATEPRSKAERELLQALRTRR
ncbi:MAG TPA: DUF6468 domain-containing protein [Candidatus Sulfotelmatobacter sp.]|nr:DUF6468 domain-containing protein [Candidatus Sulfotelmatobacter sp.]